ncbi:SIR2 family protein [Pseudoalteromonas sp. Cn5-37]|uniref:SIR2 family protein n=1 Tax=Pseudoalteromonas sp. Cn5-37 TaxID=2908886 RepID=UPI001F1B76DE|nr:SIR2 family protein [Pseudoalteromonas sp. Cn5-37]MCF2918634.1 SIR2 family protein [Pseudoalteromonas sp. Cn5-37]
MILPQELVDKLKQDKIVVFLGAGVSLNATSLSGEKLFPSWSGLLHNIAELAVEQGEEKKGNALKYAIGAFETSMLLQMVKDIKSNISGEVWRRFLRTSFSVNKNKISEESISHLKSISNINTPLFISTNYDGLFETFSSYDVKTWTQKNTAEVTDLINGELETSAIWHIHGHVDEVDSLILCSNDYNRLYLSKKSEGDFNKSKHLLKRISEQYSFLFIGFSLDDKFVIDTIKEASENNEGQIPSYYIVCRDSEANKKKEILKNIKPLIVDNYGESFLNLLNALTDVKPDFEPSKRKQLLPIIKNNLPEEEYLDTGFIGIEREVQCAEIKDKIITSRDFIFTIQGEGGVGKSAMARYIANLLISDNDLIFNNICWVSAKTEQLTVDGAQSIQGAISTFSDMRNEIGAFYNKANIADNNELIEVVKDKSLIVLDNLETISEPGLDDFLNRIPKSCKVLITSRRSVDKGLKYDPCELSKEDAKSIGDKYLKYLTTGSKGELLSIDTGQLVSKLHKNPLAIKWFVLGVYNGVEPSKLYRLHSTEVLGYCISNIYNALSNVGKKILDVLRFNGELFSYSKLCYFTNEPYSNIEDYILDELYKQSLINRESDVNKYKIRIKTRVQSYLNEILPLDESFVQDISKKENILKGRLDNFLSDEINKPYDFKSLTGVSDSNIVAAVILKDVLNSMAKTSIESLLKKVDEAKNNSPDYYEVFRVHAEVRLLQEQGYTAKTLYKTGYSRGGDKAAPYLYHYAKFLMGKGNGANSEFLPLLEKAFTLDSKSQDICFEMCRAILFKGEFGNSRLEIEKVLNSDIEIDFNTLTRICDLLLQTYKRELENAEPSKFIRLCKDLLKSYFLFPRSIRIKLKFKRVKTYFNEVLLRVSILKSSFQSQKEAEELNYIESALNAIISPHQDGSKLFFLEGFSRDGELILKGVNKVTISITPNSWCDTFPSSLLLIGDPIVRLSNNQFKRFNILGNCTEIAHNTYPATIAYSEQEKDFILAFLLNGTMIKLRSDYESKTLSPGEPIIITEIKSNIVTNFERNKHRTLKKVINIESQSKLDQKDRDESFLDSARYEGVIYFVNYEKGIAFIKSGNKNYFLHVTKLLKYNFSNLSKGDFVEFNIIKAKRSNERPC